MKGVKYGNKHSFEDWGLILSDWELNYPEAQTEQTIVPASDIPIDLTEALTGSVHFKPRKLTCTFTMISERYQWEKTMLDIASYLHGQRMKIIRDDDTRFYHVGRSQINKYKTNKATATVTIESKVDPYKYEVTDGDDWLWDPFSFIDGIIYKEDILVDGTVTTGFPVRNKSVAPTFTADSDMRVKFNGSEYDLPKDKPTKILDIYLTTDTEPVTFIGHGSVHVEYMKGAL